MAVYFSWSLLSAPTFHEINFLEYSVVHSCTFSKDAWDSWNKHLDISPFLDICWWSISVHTAFLQFIFRLVPNTLPSLLCNYCALKKSLNYNQAFALFQNYCFSFKTNVKHFILLMSVLAVSSQHRTLCPGIWTDFQLSYDSLCSLRLRDVKE